MGYLSTDEPITVRLEEPLPGTALLRVAGEVDMLSSPTLRDNIAAALGGARRRLIIDLEGVEFLGTSGLAALVEGRTSAAERNTELWLVCSRRQVLRPLRIAGLIDLFHLADTLPDALTSTNRDSETD
ncbi:MAG TPA: STAS domain-containing protein [Pseudonocardia sp.]|uniref:STAS domain-containing protein n=1 Tax=Pseudonocardia sp. TaxID=60912 RepID=UPI002C510B41|nr:STAS domain-containing protein [Pseudonocardia sp.]HTF54508.1 STAS domain-containing protein [Pseudonocardia sp.]